MSKGACFEQFLLLSLCFQIFFKWQFFVNHEHRCFEVSQFNYIMVANIMFAIVINFAITLWQVIHFDQAFFLSVKIAG